MRGPAAAIAWELGRRQRWGLGVVAGYVIVLAAIALLFPPVETVSPGRFAATVVVPLTCSYFFLLVVFTHGLDGDVAARESLYPARAFTLPVTTAALAGWPMLYGTTAAALLWLTAAHTAQWPSWFEVPRVWPALYFAAFMAWTQVLTWLPYPLPGLRVIAAVLWLASADVVAVLAIEFKPSEPMMAAALAPQIPLAFLAARAALARARRGDVPDWRGTLARLGRIAQGGLLGRNRFLTPAQAQVWFEWRHHGWSLPLWVAILLPFELALLFLVDGTIVFVFLVLAAVLFTPPVMAGFVAATVRRAGPPGSDAYGLPAFLATRPMTSAALVAAKLTATAWSTVVTWLIVIAAIPPALVSSSTWPVVQSWGRDVGDAIGMPRAIAVGLLVLAGLISTTWKRLTGSLFVALSGRAWMVRAHVGLTLAFLVAIVPFVQWAIESGAVPFAMWNAAGWVLAAVVAVKMTAAVWIVTRLHRARLLGERALVAGVACWLAAVMTLYGGLQWLVSSPHARPDFLLQLAIVGVPLARLMAAPLALAGNRHQ